MNILTIQQSIADFLNFCPELVAAQVQIIPEDKGDISNTINAALAKMGVCAIVSIASATATSSASRTIVCDARFTVEVAENPLLNRGRANAMTCTQAAEYIAGALNLTPISSDESAQPILPVFTSFSSLVLDKGTIITAVHFRATITINPPNKE